MCPLIANFWYICQFWTITYYTSKMTYAGSCKYPPILQTEILYTHCHSPLFTNLFQNYDSLMMLDVLWFSELKIAVANPFSWISWNFLCCKIRQLALFRYIKSFPECLGGYVFWTCTFTVRHASWKLYMKKIMFNLVTV